MNNLHGNKLINGVDKSGVVNSGLGKLYVHGSTRNARVFSEVKDLITVGTEINLGVVNGQTISWRSQIQGTTPNGTDFTQINGQVISNQNGTKKTD